MDYDQRVSELRKEGYTGTQANRQAYAEWLIELKAREEAMFDEMEQGAL